MSEERERKEDENVDETRKMKKRRSMSEICIFEAKVGSIYRWRKPKLSQLQTLVEWHHSMVMAARNGTTIRDGGRPT